MRSAWVVLNQKVMNIRVFFYDGVDYSTGEMLSASVAFSENYIEFIGDELLPTDKCSIIMRGTGLKDKNGLEIYEGDILSCKVFIDGKWEDSIEPVIFKEGCFGLDWSFSKDGSYWEILTKEIEGKKILGNIYENSELLERSVKADA